MNEELTHLDLFSGIGGFSLAAGWAGFRTVAFCEIDPFCQEVLAARFGAVENSERIGCLHGWAGEEGPTVRGLGESGAGDGDGVYCPTLTRDIRTLDGSRFRNVTLLTGGFPCQPFSVAGKRRGKDDDRHLWPEMLRVIHEARPRWVIGENVAGFVNMALDEVCADLEGEGYEVQPIIIPACAVNAPHRRDRVWIIGHAESARKSFGQHQRMEREILQEAGREQSLLDPASSDINARDSVGPRTDARSAAGRSRDSISESDSHAPDVPQDTLDGRDGRRGDGDTPRLRRALQTAGPDSHASDAAIDEQPRSRRIRSGRAESSNGNSWDIPWPEVATRLCGIYDGISNWLDTQVNDVLYYSHETKQKDFIEGVSGLWQAVQSQEIRGQAGRLFEIFDKKNLLAILRKLSEASEEQGDVSSAGGEIQGVGMCKMWGSAEFRRSPQRREYQKQLAGEFRNLVPSMSHESALEIARTCDEINLAFLSISSRRVARLKALGNSIVPQVAYEIIKTIAEIERGEA